VGLEAGARVSHYRLVRRLGIGGMGEVFLAEDDKLDRLVAIKFLLGTADEHSRKRLLTEARAVAALDHPNICAVHEIDADAIGGDFIVMPYVEGELLTARLQRGRIPAPEALGMCARIADALRAAHARGIVHRDLKPSNVILTPSGDPKLLDFGIAKRVVPTPEAAEAATASRLTDPYAVVGTPGYMSPEQIRSQPVDARSDLFALGCLMFECLTGHHAFVGATSADVAANVLHVAPPAPSSIVPELDASHDALVARLLQKDPDDRFQSAAEAMGAIRALEPSRRSDVTSVPLSVAAPAGDWRRRVAVPVIAAAIVVGVVLWQGPWFRRLPAAPPEAANWYAQGVEAIREGRYLQARTALDEAVRISQQYAFAHLRLAEARGELDDAFGAQAAVVKATAAIPSGARLTREEELRLTAIRSSVSREHELAIGAYRGLTDLHPADAAAWLDLGRALEAAGRRVDARESYRKALSLDSQYAAAHLRLAIVLWQMGDLASGLKESDEAIRLYRIAGHTEGEVEALTRRGEALITSGKHPEARGALTRALTLAGTLDAFYRIRIRFDLARLTAIQGDLAGADAASRIIVDEATAAGLYQTAALALGEFGYALTLQNQYEQADALFARAIELATKHQARRAEMRVRLQRASMLSAKGDYQSAIEATAEPLKYFAQVFPRAELEGKNVLARAYEGLEQYTEAARLSGEILELAEDMKEDSLVSQTLESIAGQLTNQGRLPDALTYRERIEKIDRDQKNNINLPYDLNNRAELLIRLGRGADAEPLLAEVNQRAAEGIQSFQLRERRTAMLRALRATTERRWREVEPFARVAMTLKPDAKPDSTWRWANLYLEHARAQLGSSKVPASVLTRWIDDLTSKADRRETAYWVVQILLARGDRAKALEIASKYAADPGALANSEYRWRILALAEIAAKDLAIPAPSSASIPAALREIEQLKTAWPAHADGYFLRPDLAALRQRLQ